jgi:hypothetical protein
MCQRPWRSAERFEVAQPRETAARRRAHVAAMERLRWLVTLEQPENEGEESEVVRGRVEDRELGLGLSQ